MPNGKFILSKAVRPGASGSVPKEDKSKVEIQFASCLRRRFGQLNVDTTQGLDPKFDMRKYHWEKGLIKFKREGE